MQFNTQVAMVPLLGSLIFSGCLNGLDEYEISLTKGITCGEAYKTITADSFGSIMVSSTDLQQRTVTLRSWSKYGFNQSAYNLSRNCFSRQGKGCEISDQLYSPGGDRMGLSLKGHFLILDKTAQIKYDEISFDSFDSLNLKTMDGTGLTLDTVFGNPSSERKLAPRETQPDGYNKYEKGSVLLALVDDLSRDDKYQLFKIRIERVIAGEEVSISYQRIAEAPKTELRNFYCSRQAQIRKESAKAEGEAVVFSSSYGGVESSTFGFDYGVNGFDGRFVSSEEVMSFSDGKTLVGRFNGYWGGVIDLGNKPLSEIDRSSWPDLQSIDPRTKLSEMKANHTYLVSQLTDKAYTFGAIRVTEIDPQGHWIKFNWKRVSIEKPYRFVTYTEVATPSNEAFGEVTLGNKWWKETHLHIALAERFPEIDSPVTETVYFKKDLNVLSVDNRFFPAYSGVVEVTGQYNSVDAVPASIVYNLENQFKRDAAIKTGSVYVVAAETFFAKSSLAIQVVEFVPGESVKLKYKFLYNGQTFPEKKDQ